MLTRIRRTSANTITVTVKMPIDAWSRSTVDAEVERLRHSIIPIVGADKRRRPYVVGSAVLLVYGGRKVLATAEHVMSDNTNVALSIFGANGWSRSFGGIFVVSMEHDLAVKLLSPEEIEALSHVPFLPEAVLGRAAPVGERFYASVTGYPATAAKRMARVTLDTRMEVYSDFATEQPDGRISVFFDKREGCLQRSGHGYACDPFGKSGGAIFGLALDGHHIRPQQSARLIGIPTRWKREHKRIHGSSVAILTRLLDGLLAEGDKSAA